MRDEIEVMRIVRVPPMGKMVVEASGQRIQAIGNVQNEQVRQRLLAAIGELISFAGGYEVLVEAGLAPPVAAPQPASPRADEQPLTDEQSSFLAALERDLAGAAENEPVAELPALDALAVEELASPEVKAEPPALAETPAPQAKLNMVAEIDEILQKHVAADPRLAHRSIHLDQPPGGILTIVVDGRTFEHPNDIDDPLVRQTLKMALKEWEAR